MKTKRVILSRRALLELGAVSGLALVAPTGAFATVAAEGAPVYFEAYPGLSSESYDAMLAEKIDEEVSSFIHSMSGSDGSVVPSSTNYRTVYGSKVLKSTGWHIAANQPPGGVSFGSGGGSIHVSLSGGGSVSVSVSLAGVGSIGVSLPLTSRSLSATNYSVKVPGNGKYYKARGNVSYYVQPYAVYDRGNGLLINKGAVKQFYRVALDCIRV